MIAIMQHETFGLHVCCGDAGHCLSVVPYHVFQGPSVHPIVNWR
jgi:hypothetical protein